MARTVSILISLVLHAVVIWFLIGGGINLSPEKETSTASEVGDMVATITVVPVVETAAAPPPSPGMPPPVSIMATPVAYAGVPTMAKSKDDQAHDASSNASMTDPSMDMLNGKTVKAGVELEDVEQALAVYKDGLRAPRFKVEGLTNDLIGTMVRMGIGQVVAIHGNPSDASVDQDVFLLAWANGGPGEAHRAEPGWNTKMAQRSITLAGDLGDKIKRIVNNQYSVETAPYLFVSSNLDIAILALQIRACKAQGLPLEQVDLTVGHFDLSTVDRPFIVTQVLPRKKE